MGRFYNMFYKRGETDEAYQDTPDGVVTISVPPGIATPAGYGALMSVDFAACVQTKARSMSTLPFTVVQEGRDGRKKRDDHPLAVLMNSMANEDMSASALMDWTTLRRDTFGNAYWFVEWRKGVPVAIWPINASVMHSFDKDAPRGYRVKYTVSPGDDYVPAGTYFADEVVRIQTHMTKDGTKGISLAKLAAAEIGLSIDLERFYRSMLQNGNHQLGHVEVPEGRMSDKDLEALRTAVEAKRGVSEAGKAPIFGYGAKWVTDQQTMKDASVIEQQRWVLQQVCRACNVPPWKVYDNEGATYNGGQQMRIDYVTDTIVPDVRQIELALKPVLDACGIPGCHGKFKIHGIMRGDDSTRTKYYRELGYLGVITREDVRDLEDLEPIEGIGKPLFPLNYGTVNPDGSVDVYSTERPTEPGDGSQAGNGGESVPDQE